MEHQADSNILSKPQEASKSTLILVLGILSCCLLGFLSGIPAWILGATERKKISMGLISISEKTTATIGMVLGIIGTFLSIIFIAIFISAFMTGLNVFKTASMNANRDAMIADGTSIMSLALQYYHSPKSENSSKDSFEGFKIPKEYEKTENGSFNIIVNNPESMTITCIGKEIGKDGVNPVKVIFEVKPDIVSFKKTIIN